MSLIFVARLWRGWFSSPQRLKRCTKRIRKIASSAHDRLVGCSVDRMAAHTKAAPDDSVLRLIDRALGKRNSTVHLHLTLTPNNSRKGDETEPAPSRNRASPSKNRSRLRFKSEPAPSSIRAGSVVDPSWLRFESELAPSSSLS